MENEEVKPLRGYSEEPIFYVYVHKKPGTNEVFYVGKGKKNRAYTTKSRNNHWSNVVNKYGGFDVEVIKSDMTEKESFEFEKKTIQEIGIENLTNQTLGGISTTGMVHSEETRKLQSEIMKKRLEENPELQEKLNKIMKTLHDKQRNDPLYRDMLSKKYSDYYNSLSDEEKQECIRKKTAWLQDEEKKRKSIEKLAITKNTPEYKKKASEAGKRAWENKTEEQRLKASERSRSVITRDDVRQKLMEIRCEKLVVNKSFVFKSKKDYCALVGKIHNNLSYAKKISEKFNFEFYISQGVFLEEYNEDKYSHLPQWNGEEIKRLDFDCLPRSKAVVMDDERVFLSMNEAGIFCKGKTVEATADFITKNMKKGKQAMGHSWRIASNEEIKKEIMNRLDELCNKT